MPRRAHEPSADGSRVSATARLPDAGKIFMTRMNAASTRQMPLVAISGHCPSSSLDLSELYRRSATKAALARHPRPADRFAEAKNVLTCDPHGRAPLVSRDCM